jgi:hypothetical protein
MTDDLFTGTENETGEYATTGDERADLVMKAALAVGLGLTALSGILLAAQAAGGFP